jgi:hypothetical protein
MPAIDQDGRLFGVVNVVDALVVVVVVATLLAGLAFVGGATESTDGPASAQHATMTVQGDTAVSEQVVNGTELATNAGALVVTDRARVVRANGSIAAVVRVRAAADDGLFGGRGRLSVRPGDSLRTTGAFDGLGLRVVRTGSNDSLATRRVGVVAHARADSATATSIVGAVRSGRAATDGPVRAVRVDSFPSPDGARQLRLGLTVRTLTHDAGDRMLEPGVRLPRSATTLGVAPEITTVGRTTPPGSRIDRRVVLQLDDLSPSVADALAQGDRSVATNYPATVTNVTERPATLFVADSDGRIHERSHPRLRSVTLTLSVPARQYGGVLWYQDERLQIGRSLTLDTGRVVVTGNVTAVRPSAGSSEAAESLAPPENPHLESGVISSPTLG